MKFNNNDNPITNVEEDILGFKSLAKRIATSITDSNIDTTNSFTISIEGQWGSGKTSLVNLIKNDIKDKVIVMEFNPWIVNDFEQLINYFFAELTKELVYQATWTKGAKKDDILNDLKKFARTILPDNVRIGTKTLSATYNKPKEKEETVLELKSKINDYLKELDKKIIIIVDDIDRLTDKEIETFFRLIKGIADFSNIIYLLLYDKAIVSKSLEQFKQENGEKYLDKIVQYSISIPKTYNSIINKILLEKLDKIKIYDFNEDEWNKLVPILAKYITNIRDINRVINVISFEYPQIAEDVKFIDFFIISLIKVQKYELYKAIRNREYIFDASRWEYLHSTEEYNQNKKDFFKNFFIPFNEYKPLVDKLFPSIRNEKNNDINPASVSIHKNKSIDSSYCFDNYFTFSVAENSISTKQYDNILSKLLFSNFEIFKKEILTINTPKQINFFTIRFKGIELQKTFSEIELKNITMNLLTIAPKLNVFIEYTLLSLSVLKKSKDIKNILEDIYFHSQIVPLSSKLFLFKEGISKDYFLQEKYKEILNKIENFLKAIISNITIENLINKKYGELKFYALIDYLQYFELSSDKITEELNQTIFKSKKYFFSILDLLQNHTIHNGEGYDIISYKQLKPFIEIKKIENYIDNELDKSSLTDKELNLLEYLEIGKKYKTVF